MAGQKTLGATLSAALAVNTIGAIDPFGGSKVYLPAPRSYAATWIVWWVLGLVASAGPQPARLAGRFSFLVLLAMAMLGPFGAKAVAAFESLAGMYGPGGSATAAGSLSSSSGSSGSASAPASSSTPGTVLPPRGGAVFN